MSWQEDFVNMGEEEQRMLLGKSTPEERAEVRRSNSEAQLKRWAKKTPEEMAEFSKNCREAALKREASKTPEELAAHGRKVHEAWAKKTPKELVDYSTKQSKAALRQWAKVTPDGLEAIRQQRSKTSAEMWAKRSPEEVLEVGERISKSKVEGYALKSLKEKEELRSLNRERMQAWWDSRTPEQMVIIKEQRAKTFERVRLGMSEETKALRIERIRVAAEREWADRSESERQEVGDKIRRSRSRYLKGLSDEERSQKFAGKAPNATEWFLGTLLEEEFPGEWEYVGNRKLWIGNLNPDWIHSNGRNFVIEMFGSFYHDFRYFPEKLSEEEVIEYYRLQGYKCLVLWDDELSRNFVVSSVKALMEI